MQTLSAVDDFSKLEVGLKKSITTFVHNAGGSPVEMEGFLFAAVDALILRLRRDGRPYFETPQWGGPPKKTYQSDMVLAEMFEQEIVKKLAQCWRAFNDGIWKIS